MGACCAILAHITWVLAQEWVFPFEQPKSYMGAYPGVGACLGHYGNAKINNFIERPILTNLHKFFTHENVVFKVAVREP